MNVRRALDRLRVALRLVGAAAVLAGLSGLVSGQEPAASRKVPEALLRLAQIQGSARVIVQLRADWAPEHHLSAPQRDIQRGGIEIAQRAVIGALGASGASLVRNFETIPFQALHVTPAALEALESSPDVAGVQEDRLVRPFLAQSGPIVQADQAWAAGRTGAGMMVAILDTGVAKTHSFFGGRVVAEACFSASGSCPNGSTQQIGSGAGAPCSYATDDCRHGTHVAGIAAGSGASFSGVAKGAQIMAVQVFSRFTGAICAGGPDPCALAYTSDIIKGLEHVYNQRTSYSIAAANLSLGGGEFNSYCDAYEPATKAAIDNLRSAGIATVIASGNSGVSDAISAPACISSAVSVGSTTDSDTVSGFSNSASILSLLAPGSSINSSVPGGGFAVFSGTSMATPHVTGAWAVLKQQQPSASVTTLLNALQSTGLGVTDARNDLTKPRIRVKAALDSLGVPAQIVSPAPGTTLAGPAVTFTWNSGTGVSGYRLDVGTTPGGNQLYAGPQTTALSAAVGGLPTNGSTVYVRLWSAIGGAWAFRDYTYSAVSWPTLSIDDVTVAEGNAGTVNAVFTVTMSGSSAQTVTVNYATANLTAVAGSDYTAASGTLSFSGTATRTIAVAVHGDGLPEQHEVFFVNLSGATNANIADGQGKGNIIDEDSTISVSTTTATTGQAVQVTVTGPGYPRDWVGLLAQSAPDSGPLQDWRYLNGLKTLPASGLSTATLTFNMPATPGNYNFRFYGNDTFTRLAASATIIVQAGPTLEVTPASLSFGTVYTGSTKDLTVTVKNAGSGTLAGSGTVSGAGFSLVGSTSYSLTANQTAALTVRFGPGTPGPASGTLALTGGAGASVPLSGTGATAPSLTVSSTSVLPGETITVTVANGPGNAKDWVGMYASGALDASYLAWKYLNGLQTPPAAGVASASLSFTLPSTPGTYNFRLFANNGYTKLATSAVVTVQDVPVMQVTPTSLSFGNVALGSSADRAVTVKNVGGGTLNGSGTAGGDFSLVGSAAYSLTANQSAVLTVRFTPSGLGPANGTLTLTGAGGATVPLGGTGVNTPSLSVSTTSATPGQTITVTVSDGPGNAKDWVGMYAAGATDTTFLGWKYLNGLATPPAAGVSSATLSFTLPTTPGTYNFRLFADNGYTKLATSAVVSVAPSTTPPSLSVSKTTAAPGETITVTVSNGPGNPTDWVAVHAAGAPDTTYLDWKYLNGSKTVPTTGVTSAALTFTMPQTGGDYNFRLFANNGFTKLASSATVTVASKAKMQSPPPGATLSSSSVTFTWDAGSGVTSYWLEVGTTPGGKQIYPGANTTALSATVGGLPTNGSTVYARLWSRANGLWVYNDYTYKAVTSP